MIVVVDGVVDKTSSLHTTPSYTIDIQIRIRPPRILLTWCHNDLIGHQSYTSHVMVFSHVSWRSFWITVYFFSNWSRKMFAVAYKLLPNDLRTFRRKSSFLRISWFHFFIIHNLWTIRLRYLQDQLSHSLIRWRYDRSYNLSSLNPID